MATQTFNEALTALQKTIVDEGPGAVGAIDAALATVMKYRDPRCISHLLLLLNDMAPRDEAMFSVIHAAEAFDDDTYARQLVHVLPELTANAPKWASIVLMRVLNNVSARSALVRELMRSSAETKQAATWLCQKINERSALFVEKTLPVLLAAK
jgi:hypothetical protein